MSQQEEHDVAYAEAKKKAVAYVESLGSDELLKEREGARAFYRIKGPTHAAVAICEAFLERCRREGLA